MVSKSRTHSRFSLNAQMKRSVTLLPSSSSTKNGNALMPRKAMSLATGAEVLGHALANDHQNLQALGAPFGMKPIHLLLKSSKAMMTCAHPLAMVTV